jgi:type I restriction enzyme, R subunit
LSERDICTKFITPALKKAGWDIETQVLEEVSFTDGKIFVRGKLTARGKRKRADYILYYNSNPVAIIEAKDNNHSVKSGIQQALEYARILDIPCVFSSNGDGFLFHDRTISNNAIEKELDLESFPSPQDLWNRYKIFKGIQTDEQERVVSQEYYSDGSARKPRYYQEVAINRTIDNIVKGRQRILLVMATGTGKTYTAFQIVYRLWKAKVKKRILFLADRNVLISQTKNNDFRHFGDKMTWVKNRQVDKSYEIYLALYQGISGSEEEANIYKQFSPDFFDLVVIDECHRGSAKDDSAWREILAYFKNATHIGLTATPKETDEISNIEYFGDPIYTYSLKQGIDDGFLAPYRVVRVGLNIDLEGWRPQKGKLDKDGNPIEDRIYNRKDFDRNIVIDERIDLVAKKITEFLKGVGRFSKTIVFCVDINHAERMRSALANYNSDLIRENYKYIVQITGDNEEGKRELDNFINVEEKYPVIATTSKLMSTGVDAQTCKVIVLDSNIRSMTEFKQIIGRGTRIREDFDKLYFTILDFRNVTDLFADPDFDGAPIRVKEADEEEDLTTVEDEEEESDTPIVDPTSGQEVHIPKPVIRYPTLDLNTIAKERKPKVYVNGVDVSVLVSREMYFDNEGKPITVSLKDHTREIIRDNYASLDDFLNRWKESDKKVVLIKELEEQGVLVSALLEAVNKEADLFDIIAHVAYDQPPLTRKERANNVKKRNYFTKYGEQAKKVMDALMDKYADEGIVTIESAEVLSIDPLSNFGTPYEILQAFGGKEKYLQAVKELEKELYQIA